MKRSAPVAAALEIGETTEPAGSRRRVEQVESPMAPNGTVGIAARQRAAKIILNSFSGLPSEDPHA